MLGPSGPRRLRLAVEHLARCAADCVSSSTRPAVGETSSSAGRPTRSWAAYKAHVVDQALKILRAHDHDRCLFATPRLLEALCEKIDLVKAGIWGVFCGGTEMDAQFHRFAREELVPGAAFVPTYGNTLMGLALCKPFDPADDYAITYYAPQPRAVIELVDPADPSRPVGLRRDRPRAADHADPRVLSCPASSSATRARGRRRPGAVPGTGVRDLRLLSSLEESVTVGVY